MTIHARPAAEGLLPELVPPPSDAGWELSDGEIHFIWWFIQGSIMVPDTRWALRRAWGLCERHAWGSLAAEASYRHGFLHGPTILYQDLMQLAGTAFEVRGPWQPRQVARALRPTGPCLMCDAGLGHSSRGRAPEGLVREGRDPRALRELAATTREYWQPTACGACIGSGALPRCRAHLREEARDGRLRALGPHRALGREILSHLTVYSRSFVWDFRGTETMRDRAALISAVGWCSGWRGLLAILDRP